MIEFDVSQSYAKTKPFCHQSPQGWIFKLLWRLVLVVGDYTQEIKSNWKVLEIVFWHLQHLLPKIQLNKIWKSMETLFCGIYSIDCHHQNQLLPFSKVKLRLIMTLAKNYDNLNQRISNGEV